MSLAWLRRRCAFQNCSEKEVEQNGLTGLRGGLARWSRGRVCVCKVAEKTPGERLGYWRPPGTERFVFGTPRKLEILARFSRFPRRGSAPAAKRAKLEKAAGHYVSKCAEPGAPLGARRAASSSARVRRISNTAFSAILTIPRPAVGQPRGSGGTWCAYPSNSVVKVHGTHA